MLWRMAVDTREQRVDAMHTAQLSLDVPPPATRVSPSRFCCDPEWVAKAGLRGFRNSEPVSPSRTSVPVPAATAARRLTVGSDADVEGLGGTHTQRLQNDQAIHYQIVALAVLRILHVAS